MKTQKQIEIDRLAEFLKATSVIDQTIIISDGLRSSNYSKYKQNVKYIIKSIIYNIYY